MFAGPECVMKNDEVIIAIGKTFGDNLYVMDVVVDEQDAILLVERERSPKEWHEALGHVSQNCINKALKKEGITGVQNESVQCELCPMGKGIH